MPGRNPKPVDLHLANGNVRHLSKAEITSRKKAEVKIGDQNFRCPAWLRKDKVAYKKWKELIKLFKDLDFVTTSDTGVMARYCKIWSEYLSLVEQRDKLANFEIDWDSEEINVPEILQDGINRILKTDQLSKLESLINKKHELLIKLDDRMFLNPVAKIKNIPQQDKKEEKPASKFAKFGAGRSG